MEDALGVSSNIVCCLSYRVLILVVMEDALGVPEEFFMTAVGQES